MKTTLFLRPRNFLIAAIAACATPLLAQPAPQDATNAAPASPQPVANAAPEIPAPALVMTRDWSQNPKGWKEYQNMLVARAKGIARLPRGSITALDLPYVDKPEQGESSPASNQTLDLYVPPGDGPFPLVVYIHGGSWKGGFKEADGSDIAPRWLPKGLAFASLNYRFVRDAKFPGMFQDCIDAVAFLRANADKYHVDTKRIAVMGQSAGAHLAGVVAMAEGSNAYPNSGPALQAAVLRSGFYDLTKETSQGSPGWFPYNDHDEFANLYPDKHYDSDIARKFSPLYLIHPGVPPILIEHGDKDEISPKVQSEMFLAALQKAGVDATLTNYPDYSHSLWKSDVFDAELVFLKKCFAAVR
jgi:acetyl esterase/lipase